MKTVWRDYVLREFITLFIKNRRVQLALHNQTNDELDLDSLLGHVLGPCDDIMSRPFVIYRSINHGNDVTIAPLRNIDGEFVINNQEMFQQPIDIQTFYDMVIL